jgi:hypothetical protein
MLPSSAPPTSSFANRSRLFTLASLAAALSACVEPLTETGRPCPCSGAFTCSDFNHTCVLLEQACAAPPYTPAPTDAGSCLRAIDSSDRVLIDDFEDKNVEISSGGIRSEWRKFRDNSGGCAEMDVAPIADGCRPESHFAMRLTMAGLSSWGAEVGFSLAPDPHDENKDLAFDTTAYTGVEFWARSGTIPFSFRFKVVDFRGDPAGGKCVQDAGTSDPSGCYNDPFFFEHVVTTGWTKLTVPLDQLEPSAATSTLSADASPDRKQVYQMLWAIPQPSEAGDWHQFDLWIDDVAWFR